MMCSADNVVYIRIAIVFFIFLLALWTESSNKKYITRKKLGVKNYFLTLLSNNVDPSLFSDSERASFSKYRFRLMIFLCFMFVAFAISRYITYVCIGS